MSPQNPIEPNNNSGTSTPEPLIRTMQKDIESLTKAPQQPSTQQTSPSIKPPVPEAPTQTPQSSPPADLPISDNVPVGQLTPDSLESTTDSSDIREQIREKIEEEQKLDAMAQPKKDEVIEDKIGQGVQTNPPIPPAKSIEDEFGLDDDTVPSAPTPDKPDKKEEALTPSQETDKNKQDELERRRRSEAEEQVPKEFAEKMATESLDDGKKKVQNLGTEKKKSNVLKYVIIGLGALVVIGAIGGFIYWWFNVRTIEPVTHMACQNNQCIEVDGEGEDTCGSRADCQSDEPTPPTSLIEVNNTKVIELSDSTMSSLSEKIKTIADQPQSPDTLKRILVKITSGQKHYLSLTELLQTFGLVLPVSGTADDYTLVLYSQMEGNRLGLIIDSNVIGIPPAQLATVFREQEPLMATNLNALFLGQDPGTPTLDSFSDNVYKDIAVRYMNFPSPSLTIDYAIVGDKIVITTSKDSIYKIIDALGKEIVLPPPTGDPMADWQTYTSEEYGFKIKYPSTWQIDEKIQAELPEFTAFSFTFTDNANSRNTSQLIITQKSEYPTYQDWRTAWENDFDSPPQVTLINGIEGIEMPAIGGCIRNLIFFNNGYEYSFVDQVSGCVEGNDSIQNQILSTFKFTN